MWKKKLVCVSVLGLLLVGTVCATTILDPADKSSVNCDFTVSGTSKNRPNITVAAPNGGGDVYGPVPADTWDSQLGIWSHTISLCSTWSGTYTVWAQGDTTVYRDYNLQHCPPCKDSVAIHKKKLKHTDQPPLAE